MFGDFQVVVWRPLYVFANMGHPVWWRCLGNLQLYRTGFIFHEWMGIQEHNSIIHACMVQFVNHACGCYFKCTYIIIEKIRYCILCYCEVSRTVFVILIPTEMTSIKYIRMYVCTTHLYRGAAVKRHKWNKKKAYQLIKWTCIQWERSHPPFQRQNGCGVIHVHV